MRRGADVAARSIRPGGRWTAFWNLESDPEIDGLVRSVYRRVAPTLVQEDSAAHVGHDVFIARIEAGLMATERFGTMAIDRVEWVDRVDGRRLVDRLGSHSAHRLLDDGERLRVRDALLAAVGDTPLQVRYVTEVFSPTRSP